MTVTWQLVLAIIAAVLFGLAALGISPARVSTLAAGLCVLTIAFIVAGVL